MTTPLNHPANLRDLGGLALTSGGVTRSGVLYRSDARYAHDEVPLTLPGWPPAVVVDLRSEFEREHAGAFPWPAATRTYHVPLMGEAAPRLLDRPLGDLYRYMLDASGRLIAEAVAIVAAAPGPALVQCAAGKDRTGVVIAVILLAIGVEPGHVVADYTATAANMPNVLPRVAARLGWEMPSFDDLPPFLREAPADAIAAVIPPWPKIGSYVTTKAALDKLVEAWRAEHPHIRFTRLALGDCAGGDGHSATEFINSADPGLITDAINEWLRLGYMTGNLIAPDDLVDAVDAIFCCPSAIPTLTLAPTTT